LAKQVDLNGRSKDLAYELGNLGNNLFGFATAEEENQC
jgi:hypothetical protein